MSVTAFLGRDDAPGKIDLNRGDRLGRTTVPKPIGVWCRLEDASIKGLEKECQGFHLQEARLPWRHHDTVASVSQVGVVKDVLCSFPYRRCEVSYQTSFNAVAWISGWRANGQEDVLDEGDDVSRQFSWYIVEHCLLRRYSCATKTCFGLKKPHCWVLNPKRREFDSNVIHLNKVVVGHGSVFERGVTNVERVYLSRT